MSKLRLFFLLLLWVNSLSAREINHKNTLNFDGTWQKMAVPDIYYHFEDQSNQLTIEKILGANNQYKFKKSRGRTPAFWVDGHPYWFRFNFKNDTYVNQNLFFEIQLPLYDNVEFYIVENGKLLEKHFFSWKIPQYKRTIKHRNFIFPYQLKSKQNLQCYVRIKKDFGSIWLPITIWDKDYFDYNYFVNDYHSWGFFTGVLFFVAFFSFLFSLAFKDRVYAYYAAYVFFAIGFVYTQQGYFIRFYADGSWGVEGDKVRYTAALLLLISNIFFLRAYLQWDLLPNKIFWKISNWLMAILLCLLIVMYLNYLVFNNYIFNLAKAELAILYSISFWIPLVFQFFTVVYCIQQNHNRQISIYYLFANLPILLITFYSVFISYGIVPGNQLIEIDYYALSFMVEIVVLSIMMAYRVKLIQDRNEGLLFEKNLQLQQRTEAVLEAEERERIRIARDLHDGVGQLLAAARMALGKYVSTQNITSEEVNNASELLEDSIKEIREVSHNMMPGSLMKFGLASALKQFVNKINSSSSLKIDLQIVGLRERIDERIEMMLYRIIQEITSNILKHAQASRVSIELIQHEAELILLIEDNGIGFDSNNPENQGIGLKNIATRVEYLNGSVIFDSSPNRGTSVVVEVPLNS